MEVIDSWRLLTIATECGVGPVSSLVLLVLTALTSILTDHLL